MLTINLLLSMLSTIYLTVTRLTERCKDNVVDVMTYERPCPSQLEARPVAAGNVKMRKCKAIHIRLANFNVKLVLSAHGPGLLTHRRHLQSETENRMGRKKAEEKKTWAISAFKK